MKSTERDNSDISKQRILNIRDRLAEIKDWSFAEVVEKARNDDVELNVEHLAVLFFLRAYYAKYGWPNSVHKLTQRLEREFAEKGGKKYLHKLFPGGPVTEGTQLAGLPTPAFSADGSCGTTH